MSVTAPEYKYELQYRDPKTWQWELFETFRCTFGDVDIESIALSIRDLKVYADALGSDRIRGIDTRTGLVDFDLHLE